MEPLTADDPRQVSVFRLHSRLGAGGMGRVYLATSPGGRAVAVKVVHPELARDPEFTRRFRREVEAASSRRCRRSTAAAVLLRASVSYPPSGGACGGSPRRRG